MKEACTCPCHSDPHPCMECCNGAAAAPPASDLDIVMRFRNHAAELVALVPDEADPTTREKRSRVVTMMFRAAIQELVAHIGPNAQAITFVFTREMGKAIADYVEEVAALKNKENVN